jgi:hypothetical protein
MMMITIVAMMSLVDGTWFEFIGNTTGWQIFHDAGSASAEGSCDGIALGEGG